MLCPLCKEEIKDGALKCKHCGSMIATTPSPNTAPSITPEKMALVRLQRLHGEIAGAHPGRGSGCLVLLISGLLGFFAFLLITAGLQGLNVGPDWWVPIALLVFVSVWISLAVLLQRSEVRKADRKKAALRQQLSDAIQEAASASPDWVASLGGSDALLDGQRFRELLLAHRSIPGLGSNQEPQRSNRHCPDCDLQVTQNAAVCPSCKTPLYKGGRGSAVVLAYLYAGLLAGLIAGPFILFLPPLAMIVFGIAYWVTYNKMKTKLLARRDLALPS